jgi:hypothetical protein
VTGKAKKRAIDDKKRKLVEYVHIFAKITRQELIFGSSGDGTEKYPLRIGKYIELAATLDKPFKAVWSVEVSRRRQEKASQGWHISEWCVE